MSSASTTKAGKLKPGDKFVDASVRDGYVTVKKTEISGKNIRVITDAWTKVMTRDTTVIVLD